MQTYKNLYETICSYDNLHQAYLEARRCKRYREEILEYTLNLEPNLRELQNELINKTYKTGRYKQHYVYDPKKRLIMSLPFKDRILQWAVYQVISPLFTKTYIYDSYGSIPNKGTEKAVLRLQYWLRLLKHQSDEPQYVLIMDVTKFFFRVSHEVMMELLSRKIVDKDLMWLFNIIINSDTVPFGLPLDVKDLETCERLFDVGMPVGNLLSQFLANFYMDMVDQFVKRTKRATHYIRYMDDMLILSHSKQELRELKLEIEEFLNTILHLHLNKKTTIRTVDQGIDFLGYRVWGDKIKLRKKSALRMRHRLQYECKLFFTGKVSKTKALEVYNSYVAHIKLCTGNGLKERIEEIFKPILLYEGEYYIPINENIENN